MSLASDSERIDMLLALALALGDEGGPAPGGAVTPGVLSALKPSERQAVERRAGWYARLAPHKQREWLAYTHARARAREKFAPLDEHVHPSQIVEALAGEPTRVREMVVRYLPPALAAAVAEELGVGHVAPGDGLPAAGEGNSPAPEVIAIVRRKFLAHFAWLGDLARATPLEYLSGAELARLIRLLGARETATACRGIAEVEAVTAFLRRFAAEDARAIATHIATLTDVDPRRVAFAETNVREALSAEPEPGGMLDRTGLRLLAFTLSGREGGARLRYTAQKLPVAAARWLEQLAREATSAAERNAELREMMRAIAQESEAAAAGLRRGRRRQSSARRGEHARAQESA